MSRSMSISFNVLAISAIFLSIATTVSQIYYRKGFLIIASDFLAFLFVSLFYVVYRNKLSEKNIKYICCIYAIFCAGYALYIFNLL
ncbi:hypothetical protein FHS74_005145 [Nitrospirillum iridis]|uniref:Uncharacterized protein n=1 Tax=Nitrospirillum iridis TaxID=765888 RepID=A0A7X0B2L3_9PROT|nr:hypothetical protein [Nitrospirillum iridis]